ncbi:MAG: haloacid dehalogenase type II [Rhodobacteraceae bacterium]|nr:haloacid dehalogenase type II [Paracoccaceae bacterium]MBR9820254.1 haloacid dehalogenase type II [Paracoccaceae bacterium]
MTITTCIFDAYGTLFDVNAAARAAAAEPGRTLFAARSPALAEKWRLKQLEYSWQRAIRGIHCDFWQVTQDGLDWAMASEGIEDPELRERLLSLYWQLDAFPEVPHMLAALRGRGLATGILSNGSPEMLSGAVQSAGLEDLLGAVLSVESVGVFKPARPVYDLVGQHFGCAPKEVLFVSSNGWDASAAAEYGFVTAWVNRAGQPAERLPGTPAHVLSDLSSLPDLDLF